MTLRLNLKLDRSEGFSLNAQGEWPLQGITAITGPSGSGKSTVTRSPLAACSVMVFACLEQGEVMGYTLAISDGETNPGQEKSK